MPLFALTIFIGAFLLFQVQPLIGKYILPWFGGGPGVWTTCMVFFQVMLLAGYAYAHFSSQNLKPRAQVIVHLSLLVAALVFLPITPADSWKPQGGREPTLHILALLTVCIGLPYFVLSSTGPLVQHWFSRTHPGTSPYRLFALSNAGSLLALVSYPFFFETHLTRQAQARLWGWGLVAYVACSAACLLRLKLAPVKGGDQPPVAERQAPDSNNPTPSLVLFLWLLLPACASVLLLAVTNKLCQDVAVIPFLWVLPLAVYLLSFIICFDNSRWYVRFPFTLALMAAIAALCWALFKGGGASLYKQVAVYCGGLFVCCMVCHGELYRLKPDPSQLTGFYLTIATGGAFGGLFVGLAAPLLFTNYYELHFGLLLCAILFLTVRLREWRVESANETATAPPDSYLKPQNPLWSMNSNYWGWLAVTLPVLTFGAMEWILFRMGKNSGETAKVWIFPIHVAGGVALGLNVAYVGFRRLYKNSRGSRVLVCLWLSLGVVALGIFMWMQMKDAGSEKIYRSRNFYGVLAVFDHRRDEPSERYFLLQHGRITHGLQFAALDRANLPTSYYGEESGVGRAVRALAGAGRRIGLVGLGTGTLAAYGQPEDYFRIYEINPEVKRLALSQFSYLRKCAGKVDVVLGDARLSLEKEPPQNFDLLVLDAFSSDAIPVHLLTREAFELYQRHLKPNAIIAVHISNHYLNLEPVVANLASHFGYRTAMVETEETDEEWWLYASSWVLLSRSEEMLNSQVIRGGATALKTGKRVPPWTDDFTSLFQILKK